MTLICYQDSYNCFICYKYIFFCPPHTIRGWKRSQSSLKSYWNICHIKWQIDSFSVIGGLSGLVDMGGLGSRGGVRGHGSAHWGRWSWWSTLAFSCCYYWLILLIKIKGVLWTDRRTNPLKESRTRSQKHLRSTCFARNKIIVKIPFKINQ